MSTGSGAGTGTGTGLGLVTASAGAGAAPPDAAAGTTTGGVYSGANGSRIFSTDVSVTVDVGTVADIDGVEATRAVWWVRAGSDWLALWVPPETGGQHHKRGEGDHGDAGTCDQTQGATIGEQLAGTVEAGRFGDGHRQLINWRTAEGLGHVRGSCYFAVTRPPLAAAVLVLMAGVANWPRGAAVRNTRVWMLTVSSPLPFCGVADGAPVFGGW